ncbi:helix-turn-helix domain-containing protein [Peptoanaerobacter stomatis]|nr:helix-turn-helix domain-containing protein [Peptoanaerobacter stomatis]
MELVQRAFKGIWIPAEIWLAEDLTIIEKLFLVEINSLDNEKGCFATNKHFSEFFGVSKGRCSQIINSLKEKGYISVYIKREGEAIKERVLKTNLKLVKVDSDTPLENDNPLFRKCEYPYLENDKENNTLFNNTFNNTNNKKEKKKSEFDLLIDDYTENEELKKAIYDFIVMRKTIKKPLTTRALNQILNKLNEYAKDYNTKIKILDQSIEHCWQSIYELKDNNNYQDYSKKGEANAGTTDKPKQPYTSKYDSKPENPDSWKYADYSDVI